MSEHAAIVMDTINGMLVQEASYRCSDYLHALNDDDGHITSSKKRPPIDEKCRSKMARWCFQVTKACGFQGETAEIAMSCLDRFMAADPDILSDRFTYRLAFITSVYTATKVHENEGLNMVDMEDLGNNNFARDQVVDMENRLLKAIQWRVNPPTAMGFVHELLDCIIPLSEELDSNDQKMIMNMTQAQIESSLSDYAFVAIPSSLIACASLMNALQAVLEDVDVLVSYWGLISNALNLETASRHKVRAIQSRLFDLTVAAHSNEEQQQIPRQTPSSPSASYRVPQNEALRSSASQSSPVSVSSL